MGTYRKYAYLLLLGIAFSCTKDSNPAPPEAVREFLTAVELEFLEEYEYVTFNLSPTSFGATVNEKWQSDIKLFLDGNISDAYRTDVSNALTPFNSLFGVNGPSSSLVNTLEASNVHLIFGEKSAIENIWPDMFDAIGSANFQGYALYNRDQNFNITRGRIWVRTPSIPLFNHELGHIIGLGHASPGYCGNTISSNESFMCSFLKEEFSSFDNAMIQTLYSPETEVGKTFPELRPIIENLLLSGKIVVE